MAAAAPADRGAAAYAGWGGNVVAEEIQRMPLVSCEDGFQGLDMSLGDRALWIRSSGRISTR